MEPLDEAIRRVLADRGGEATSSELLYWLKYRGNAALIRAAVARMADVTTEKRYGVRGAPATVYRVLSNEES